MTAGVDLLELLAEIAGALDRGDAVAASNAARRAVELTKVMERAAVPLPPAQSAAARALHARCAEASAEHLSRVAGALTAVSASRRAAAAYAARSPAGDDEGRSGDEREALDVNACSPW